MKLEFSGQILEKKKKKQISNSIKIRPAGTELFHADRRTDKTKLKSLFAMLQSRLKQTTEHSATDGDVDSIKPFYGSVVIGFCI